MTPTENALFKVALRYAHKVDALLNPLVGTGLSDKELLEQVINEASGITLEPVSVSDTQMAEILSNYKE